MGKIGREDYAWYVGYAPADKPEIAISIVINEKHLISEWKNYNANCITIIRYLKYIKWVLLIY